MEIPRLVAERILWQGYGKQFIEREFEFPDGTTHLFYVLGGTTDPVIIFALTDDEEVVAVRQFRHGANDIVLELPGGVMNDGEMPLATVMKELMEETGYQPDRPDQVMPLGESAIRFEPAALTHSFLPFLALGCRKVAESRPEATEIIEVVLIPLDEWVGKIRSGEVCDSKSITVTMLALLFLGLGRIF